MPTATAAESERTRLVLVTGLSGSGKSVAANAFEDLGFYCVDNLPVGLLRLILADPQAHLGAVRQIAVVADLRSPGFAEAVPGLLAEIDRDRFDFVLLFLEASDAALLRRYSETRRSHPMGEGDRPVPEGIRREKELLAPLRAEADLLFDTSDWSVHDMRRAVTREFGPEVDGSAPLTVSILSFGFKHGPPAGADLQFDVRFLANPYFHPGLREQTGRDDEVVAFLEASDDFGELLARVEDLLLFLLPRYVRENRRYLTVAIGCTGGRHRSVASVEAIAERLDTAGWSVRVSHRDLERR